MIPLWFLSGLHRYPTKALYYSSFLRWWVSLSQNTTFCGFINRLESESVLFLNRTQISALHFFPNVFFKFSFWFQKCVKFVWILTLDGLVVVFSTFIWDVLETLPIMALFEYPTFEKIFWETYRLSSRQIYKEISKERGWPHSRSGKEITLYLYWY